MTLTNASSHVGDVEAPGDSHQEVQDQLEIPLADAGRAVDEETDVHRVETGFTSKHKHGSKRSTVTQTDERLLSEVTPVSGLLERCHTDVIRIS